MKNCELMKLKTISDKRGNMIPLEYPNQLPFELKRIYYIYGVPKEEERGFHSHNDLEQILISVKGSVKILTKTPYEEEETILDDPSKGLYVGPMIWRKMFEFSEDAVLLVLASKEYNEDDYIRDYTEYEKKAIEYFRK